ncbi:hypothetical protein VPH35_006418 [Triticum aestivum]|uniref:F-ATPase protein 6 n=1 Tax=Triticum aestivum TaxID=4565 RepID=A0A3B5YRX2_WHEAT|nr:ATP synthase subunit a-like [Triticum aestivum]
MRFLSTDMKDRNMLFAAITTNQPIRSKCSRLPDLHDFFPTNISENFAIMPNLDITPTPKRIAGVTIFLQIEGYLGQNESEQGAVNLARTVLGARHQNGKTWQGILEDIRAGGGMDNFIQNLPGAYPNTPLDQFVIIPIIDLHVGKFYLSFTNEVFYVLLTVVLVVFLFFVVTKKGGGKSVPNAWQSLVELIYDFVLNLVNEQIGGLSGNVKQKFFPRITFTFSLFRNPQGMIPFSFTVTSHFLITLALSFSIFIGITIVGFQRHGLHFFSFLLPAGVPLPLAPFLVLLELISYCFHALSLGIRLFANMMAGHSLVKILSGFAWTMLFLNNIFYFIGDLGPLFIVLALTGLELGVAISQAHVSTISICIYLNDATNLHQNESFHN